MYVLRRFIFLARLVPAYCFLLRFLTRLFPRFFCVSVRMTIVKQASFQLFDFIFINKTISILVKHKEAIFVHVCFFKHAVRRDCRDKLTESQTLIVSTVTQTKYSIRKLIWRYATKLVKALDGQCFARVLVLVFSKDFPKFEFLRVLHFQQFFQFMHSLVVFRRNAFAKKQCHCECRRLNERGWYPRGKNWCLLRCLQHCDTAVCNVVLGTYAPTARTRACQRVLKETKRRVSRTKNQKRASDVT